MNFELIKQCLSKIHEMEKKVEANGSHNKEIYERLNYIQKDIATNRGLIDQQDLKLKEMQQSIGEDFMVVIG
jgi:uncharacterized protein YoxC